MKKIDLSNNNLNDIGINSLIQKMASLGAVVEELDLSGNKISDETLKNLADHVRKGNIKVLTTVKADDTNVT
jgi:Ran GTPase-activating protein (RanGAP) involved in mRNA processing and transport